MSYLDQEMYEDSVVIINEKELQCLSEAVTVRQELETIIVKLTTELEKKVEIKKYYDNELLPRLMQEANCKEYTALNGDKIVLTEEVYASISEANSIEAYDWLRSNGYDPLIKDAIEINIGKDKEFKKYVARVLDKAEVDFKLKSSVHWKTLRNFVKEVLEKQKEIKNEIAEDQTENGEQFDIKEDYEKYLNFPAQLFSAYQKQVVRIQPKKG